MIDPFLTFEAPRPKVWMRWLAVCLVLNANLAGADVQVRRNSRVLDAVCA